MWFFLNTQVLTVQCPLGTSSTSDISPLFTMFNVFCNPDKNAPCCVPYTLHLLPLEVVDCSTITMVHATTSSHP